MSKKVSDILPKTEILAQLAEEASERTIKDMADNLFEERQAMLVWVFVNVCLVVCTAVVMGWK